MSDGFRRGAHHTAESRARIARGVRRFHERRREMARQEAQAARQAALVRPADIRSLEESGSIAEPLVPFVEAASYELAELLDALGGLGGVSAQRRLIAEDLVRVGVVMKAELARFVQSRDGDAGARVGTMANARRQALVALGLEHHEHDVSPVDEYAQALEAVASQVPAASHEEDADAQE